MESLRFLNNREISGKTAITGVLQAILTPNRLHITLLIKMVLYGISSSNANLLKSGSRANILNRFNEDQIYSKKKSALERRN